MIRYLFLYLFLFLPLSFFFFPFSTLNSLSNLRSHCVHKLSHVRYLYILRLPLFTQFTSKSLFFSPLLSSPFPSPLTVCSQVNTCSLSLFQSFLFLLSSSSRNPYVLTIMRKSLHLNPNILHIFPIVPEREKKRLKNR